MNPNHMPRNSLRDTAQELTVNEKAAAFDALERLARSGHGPAFTQRAVLIGQRAVMGTGDDSASFAAAIIAIEKTTE